MARPGQVVEVVAKMLGINEATVTLHNRNLREAGGREVQSRGRGKGSVSARDVAMLLISLLGTTSPKESDDAARRYGGLLFSEDDRTKRAEGPTRLLTLLKNHTFLEGLTVLIEDSASGALIEWVARKLECEVDCVTERDLHIRVGVSFPYPEAMLSVWPVSDGEPLPGCELRYGRFLYYDKATGKNRLDPPFRPPSHDLGWERFFGGETILAIGKVIAQ